MISPAMVNPVPEAKPGLAAVDRMIVSTGRLVAHGLGACPPIANTFAILCGAEAKDALNAFRMLLWQLRDHGWRRMRIPPPGFDGPSNDERAILGLIAAAQAQDQGLLDARLRWLVKRDGRRCAETAATVVGMALAMNGNFVLLRPQPSG